MIQELNKKSFHRIEKLLLDETGGNVESTAVIEGNNPGRIFVDDVRHPRSALLWFQSPSMGFGFLGDPENHAFNPYLNRLIDDVIQPEAKELGWKWFEFTGVQPGWRTTFEEVFQNRQLDDQYSQQVYRLDHLYESDHLELPAGYQLCKVNRDLMNFGFTDRGDVRDEILQFWATVDDFLDKGIGYCATFGNRVVSL